MNTLFSHLKKKLFKAPKAYCLLRVWFAFNFFCLLATLLYFVFYFLLWIGSFLWFCWIGFTLMFWFTTAFSHEYTSGVLKKFGIIKQLELFIYIYVWISFFWKGCGQPFKIYFYQFESKNADVHSNICELIFERIEKSL